MKQKTQKRIIYYKGEKKAQPEGADATQHGTRTLLYTNNTLLLLAGANPITSIATIFMFLLELEAFATLYELRTRRTPKSRCIIYKSAYLSVISANILTFWKCEIYHRIITQAETQPPASINSNPPPIVLNNANTFPEMLDSHLHVPTDPPLVHYRTAEPH